MIIVIVWLGLYPQPILNTAGPALDSLRRSAAAVTVKFDSEAKTELPVETEPGLSPDSPLDCVMEETRAKHESS